MADPNQTDSYARDGTRQAARYMPALDPAYVPLDERSAQDLLIFVRQFAQEIRYYTLDDEVDGAWTSFLGSSDNDLSLSRAAAFLQTPALFDPTRDPELYRPHFVLFLAFLKLFQNAQIYLNGITGRHLDFYYRNILGMRNNPATPDQVNLILALAPGMDAVEVPAATRASAGRDSAGRDLIYATDSLIVVNRAQIAQISSACLDKRFIGTKDARTEHKNDREDAVQAMLTIALGDPTPGDPLPPYPGEDKTALPALLDKVRNLLQFAHGPNLPPAPNLYMNFFDLDTLMQLKQQRDNSDGEWTQINGFLQKAGKKRDGNFNTNFGTSRNFEQNLETAVGGKPDFSGLPEVKSVYDAYDFRTRSDVEQFIEQKLFMDPADFATMMQIKLKIDAQWNQIDGILQQAGAAKTPGFDFTKIPNYDPTDFAANLKTAVNPDFTKAGDIGGIHITDIDSYYKAVQQARAYFYISPEVDTSLEDLLTLLNTFHKTNPDPTDAEWAAVDIILGASYKEKTYSARRAALQKAREDAEKNKAGSGFAAMLLLALGEDPKLTDDAASLLSQIQPFVLSTSDFQTLQAASDPANNTDWQQVYGIVEVAQRNVQALPEPVPYQTDWRNLYPAPDATKELVLGFQGSADVTRWKTFGEVPASTDPKQPPTTLLGMAFSSPLLAMSEGTRTITLTLGFHPEQWGARGLDAFLSTGPNPYPIKFEISTKKGWLEAPSLTVTNGNSYTQLTGGDASDLKGIQWILQFDQKADAFAPPPPGQPGDQNPWPILRMSLRENYQQALGQFTIAYPPIADLLLAKAHVTVKVQGITGLSIANDGNALNPKKPFLPFGTAPIVGQRFFVSHPELVTKRLDSVTFNLQWMGAPADFQQYYKNYDETLITSASPFKTTVLLFDEHTPFDLADHEPLFPNPPNSPTYAFSVNVSGNKALQNYVYVGLPDADFPADVVDWSRYFIWELEAPDFQHEEYPAVAAAKAVQLAADIANKGQGSITADNYKVNPPYTPKLKSLTVDYTASLELTIENTGATSVDQFYHLHPFGYNYIAGDPVPGGFLFMPSYENQGELYIGLQNVEAPQNVSILFQAAEGSANPDLTPPTIGWSVLNGDQWDDADGHLILGDTTRGLINTGIIQVNLPEVAPSMRMPAGLYWIRAVAQQNSTAVCDTIALQTQAVSATLVDNGNAADHYSTPLPVASIKRFISPIAGIASVSQPYTSRGGRAAEVDSAFYTRVSERLRHKQRAVSAWDYERLVLAQFPDVYKVKCIPAALQPENAGSGLVQVVVIPDIRNKIPFDPFEPKAPADVLRDIQDFLSTRVPDWVDLRVQNAQYIAVKVRLAVRFIGEGDESYYAKRLNDDLNRYLAPWAYDEGADIVIGGRIYANSIVDFVDRQPYVDYIAKIELFSSSDGENFTRILPPQVGDPNYILGYFVEAQQPNQILVAAHQHQIDVISDAGYSVQKLVGIGYMTIELDFVVA